VKRSNIIQQGWIGFRFPLFFTNKKHEYGYFRTVVKVEKNLYCYPFKQVLKKEGCNQPFTYQALKVEDKSGVMLPCK
jgi:hypothetical protein